MTGPHPDVAAGPPGPTGHPAVDEAVAALAAVTGRPPHEQVSAFERAHEILRQTLESIDQS